MFAPADFDRDGDVDRNDFGLFQACMSGPNLPADPNCLGVPPVAGIMLRPADPGLGDPGRLPAPGSHRPVRAHISAYGSSGHGFAAFRHTEWTAIAGGRG